MVGEEHELNLDQNHSAGSRVVLVQWGKMASCKGIAQTSIKEAGLQVSISVEHFL